MEEGKPSVNVLVSDRFTDESRDGYSLDEPLTLAFSGKERNLHDDVARIEGAIGSKIEPLILDLYRIALVVYVWDIRTPRSSVPRHLHALISVSNKDKWDASKSHLEATLRFLTGDAFTFHFVQGTKDGAHFAFKKGVADNCILLFSGGLDSLAGAKWAIDRKLNPILISHPGGSVISASQRRIVSGLNQVLARTLSWHQIRATPQRGKELRGQTSTQFSRSFLYLAIGTVFALKLGIEKLFICENGVLALNVPLTQARVYDSTKTVHPRFLKKYQELLEMVYGRHVTVENPFLSLTKGEVLELLNANGFRELVPLTTSCSEVQRLWRRGVKTSSVRHCGVCFPCVIRRIAIHRAGITEDAKYANDIEQDYARIPEEGRKLLFEMAEFAREIDRFSTVDEALSEFHEFMVEDYDPATLFEMTKRQVAQFEKYVQTKTHVTLRDKLGIRSD